jgi:hypothetical protein
MWPDPDPRSPGGRYRPVQPPSPIRLLFMFVLVVLAIWYLTTLG